MKKNDKRLKNLKPMKPGETRNPNGRPVGSLSMTTILKNLMNKKMDLVNDKPVNLINLKLIQKAMKGDVKAIEMIWDRLEGKPQQSVKMEGYIKMDLVETKILAIYNIIKLRIKDKETLIQIANDIKRLEEKQ